MGEDYDSSKPSKYTIYLDAKTFMVGLCRNHYLHKFKWINDEELEDWRSFSCILEVDLEYPESLYDLHNDYQLAPENSYG